MTSSSGPNLPLEIFTTLRLQCPPSSSVSPAHIPLFPLHLQRLQSTYQSLNLESTESPNLKWWEARVLEEIDSFWRSRLADAEGRTEMRVKVLASLTSPPVVRVEGAWLPKETAAFNASPLTLPVPTSTSVPRVILSARPLLCSKNEELFLRHKTTKRDIYDLHSSLIDNPTHSPWILPLLYVAHPDHPSSPSFSLITETSISNILFLPPASAPIRSSSTTSCCSSPCSVSERRWLTPASTPTAPFLPGLMRISLLSSRTIFEREITLDDVRGWMKESETLREKGGAKGSRLRVAACNALRGVWEVELEAF